jgi:hypothetical protein
MLLTLVLAAVSPVPAATIPLRPVDRPLAVSMRKCRDARTYHAHEELPRARARRLDELPPGRLELTVLREFDGCPIPAVLREGLGGRVVPEGADPARR